MTFLRKLRVIAIVAGFVLVAAAQAQDAKPLTFDLGPLKATCTPPGGWKVTEAEGTPPSFFDEAKKGNISFVASPMQMPEETFSAMHKAALDQAKAKLAAGDYSKAQEHSVDGFAGLLTVESAKDPSMRRMQWQGYGRGGYYTIMMASSGEAFEGYEPTFSAFLASVKLKAAGK